MHENDSTITLIYIIIILYSLLSTEWHRTAQPERLHSTEVSDQQVGIQQLQLGGQLASIVRASLCPKVNRNPQEMVSM